MSSISTQKLCINADAFLWACIEAYGARRQANGGFNSHTRFEPFLFGSWKEPAQRTLDGFVAELRQIVSHHWEILPQYRRGEDVDLETISFFSQATVTLLADIETLFKGYTGLELPPVLSGNPGAKAFPTLAAVMERYDAHLKSPSEDAPAFVPWSADGDVDEEKREFSAQVWSLLEKTIRETLGDYTPLIQIFTQWKFAPKAEPEPIDWRVRPPVGEAFIKWLKQQDPDYFRRQREERRGGRGRDDRAGEGRREGRREEGGRGDHRPERSEPREQGEHKDHADQRPERGEHRERGEHKDHADPRPERGEHRDHAGHRPEHGEPKERSEHRPEHKEHAHREPRHEPREHRAEREPRADVREQPERAEREPRADRGGRFGERRPREEGRGNGEGRRERFRDDDRPRRTRDDRPRRPRDGEGGPQQSSEAQLEAVVAEARAAIETLRSNPSVAEVPLAPVNSFLRRHQHTTILEAGFETESRGEGRDRCVFVKRKA